MQKLHFSSKKRIVSFFGVLLFISIANISLADELKIPFISKGACPFECCTYGEWDVLKETNVYEKPDLNSTLIVKISPNQKVHAVTGNVHVIPGRAKVIGEPHSSASNLDREKEILILDYIGEGHSRVFQDGKFATIKIARTKERCKENPNWRYCWVEVLQEPICDWWVFIKTKNGKTEGWVLMEGVGLKAIDGCS